MQFINDDYTVQICSSLDHLLAHCARFHEILQIEPMRTFISSLCIQYHESGIHFCRTQCISQPGIVCVQTYLSQRTYCRVSKLVYWSQFLFLLVILLVIIRNCMPFYVYNFQPFCLENYAIQMLTISSYAFSQPGVEVVHWASYHVGEYCRDFMFSRNFSS
jgi:hypothetical protein